MQCTITENQSGKTTHEKSTKENKYSLFPLFLPFLFVLILFSTPLPASAATEREALEALYDSTDGAGWTNSTGWKTAPDHCTWYGVTCSGGLVTVLDLSSNNLNGTIPAEIGYLTNLTSLNLFNNQLSGAIPSAIGALTNLQELDLDYNQMTGGIPAEIVGLSNLQVLYLSNNQLSGAIPSVIGTLSNLTTLSLWENQLSGAIPSAIGALANLEYLYLSDNQLSEAIPAEIANLTQLQELYLDHNQLTGTIPSAIGSLSNLTQLSLWVNQLSGAIPSTIGSLTNLDYLDLDNNLLTGAIPEEIGNLSILQELYLNNNQLTGSIPVEIGNLVNLTRLDLSHNQLSGTIPAEIGNLANLTVLNLSYNQLICPIPAAIDNLKNHCVINFSNNQLGACGGDITITIDPNPDSINAPWTLTGPNSFSRSLRGDTVNGYLDPGEYTVTWGDVAGWEKPAPQTQTLAGASITFTGTYYSCNLPAKVNSTYYNTIQDAYDHAATGDTIQLQEYLFIENVLLGKNIRTILQGGYNCPYDTNTGYTTIDGSVTITNGTVTIDKVIIK